MAIDLEKILRPVDTPMPEFPARHMTLVGGEERRETGRVSESLVLDGAGRRGGRVPSGDKTPLPRRFAFFGERLTRTRG